ncbi:MAG: class I SAM-dependent rRNA methyltransferase [Chloroflexota bacterium]
MPQMRIILKPGKEKPVLNQHPWVFSGAIRQTEGSARPGDVVEVRAHDGQFLGRGYWNPQSQIQVRLLTWQDEAIDDAWWRRMLKRAIDARAHLSGDAVRLVNAESDFLPGLVVDRYDRWLVMQALTLGIDQQKHRIADILSTLVDVAGIYERSDVDVRAREGLGVVNGVIWGKEPPERVTITEAGGRQFYVDIYTGHKTGHYLDQAANRRALADLLHTIGGTPSVLNLFSYTGGFGVYALPQAGEVVNVDSSYDALTLAEDNVQLNGLPTDRAEFIQADVFDYLRDLADQDRQFDVVVLDPPKFAQNKGQVDRAARGYKDINLNAFYAVRPGGWLLTFSCSGAISADLFQKIVFGALADSGRQAQVVRQLGPGDDHPVALTFPEGAYLKGLLLRVY